MQHLQMNRGTISLTERVLRHEMPLLTRYLRNAILTSDAETIDIFIDGQHLKAIDQALNKLIQLADSGEKSLITTLKHRWSALAMPPMQ